MTDEAGNGPGPENQGKSGAPGADSSGATPSSLSAGDAAVREQIKAERAKLSQGKGTPKTMLDPQAMREALARATAEKEAKVAEEMKARANEPVKPFVPIENFKQCTPCGATWDNPDLKERFRYCEQCHSQVYDFTGMELPEAEELIFKRENRKNAPLFKRADGKFLTSDCPMGVKKKRDMMMLICGGVVAVAALVALLISLPRPQPAVTDQPAGTDQPAPVATETPSTESERPVVKEKPERSSPDYVPNLPFKHAEQAEGTAKPLVEPSAASGAAPSDAPAAGSAPAAPAAGSAPSAPASTPTAPAASAPAAAPAAAPATAPAAESPPSQPAPEAPPPDSSAKPDGSHGIQYYGK